MRKSSVFFAVVMLALFCVSCSINDDSASQEPRHRYLYKAETGAYIEASRKETFSVCPDKEIQGTWISEHSVSLNAENCLSVKTPNIAGTFRVLFLENDGKTDTIQVLVDQSYIQMGDYSHKIWVADMEKYKKLLSDNKISDYTTVVIGINIEEYGHYENRSYNQPLIVDKTKLTMADAQHYSKISDIMIATVQLNSYSENEKLEESRLPFSLAGWRSYGWKFANARSKKEGLDTAYIMSATGLTVDTLASGYRMPYEEEWFFLMRAGASTKYYWGDEEDSLTVSRYEWVKPLELKPVAKLQPNRFGLYDMISIAEEVLCYEKLSPECYLIEKIGPHAQFPRTSQECILETDATEWKCSEPKQKLEIRSTNRIGFRYLRKTPKLHKLEKL